MSLSPCSVFAEFADDDIWGGSQNSNEDVRQDFDPSPFGIEKENYSSAFV